MINKVIFNSECAKVINNCGKTMMTAEKLNGLYLLNNVEVCNTLSEAEELKKKQYENGISVWDIY